MLVSKNIGEIDKRKWTKLDDTKRIIIRGKYCVYCGAVDQSREHWPPRNFSADGYILPCCFECNFRGGTLFPENFIHRYEYIQAGKLWNVLKYIATCDKGDKFDPLFVVKEKF